MKRIIHDCEISKVEGVLECFSQNNLFRPCPGYRDPRARIAVARNRLLKKYAKYIEELEALGVPAPAANPPKLSMALESLESLLFAQFEFVDDCQGIARQLITKTNSSSGERHYKRLMKDYRKELSEIVNGVKHRQARLRPVYMLSRTLGVPGFFLEQVYEDGSLGPNRELHDGGCTATSLVWSAKYHFYFAFYVLQSLCEVGLRILEDSKLECDGVERREDELALRVATQLQLLPNVCFPNETWESGVDVSVASKKSGKCIVLSPTTKFRSLSGGEFKFEFEGDGVTRKFRMPYMGDDWQALIARNLTRHQA